jgi:subtilase family serine protease
LAICLGTAAQPARAEMPTMLARAAAAETTTFGVFFPLQNEHALEALIAAQSDPGSQQYHHFLTPQQFRQQFGTPASTVEAAETELRAAGFTVVSRSAFGLQVAGSVGAIEGAFGVRLSHAVFGDGTRALVADRPLALTSVLAASGAHIPQFTTIPPRHQHHVIRPVRNDLQGALGPYYTADLRQAYDYPSVLALNGLGVTIGVLMNGGFNRPDMVDYYFTNGFSFTAATNQAALISTVNISGGAPYDPSTSTETHLDIQQSSGMSVAPTVVLYNLPDLSDGSIISGLVTIVEDNKADVVNMSFGGPENVYLAANNGGVSMTWYLTTIEHALFLQGNAQGITFVASSGDHGAIPLSESCKGTVCKTGPTLTPQTPASDPNVTGVGGTTALTTTAIFDSFDSAYIKESSFPDTEPGGEVWGSGGGISAVFAKPAYQSLVVTPSKTFRTVPDLALHMGGCPGDATDSCASVRSSDFVWIGGQAQGGIIGTSASAPDITGLIALKIKLSKSKTNPSGRQGNINTYIYTQAKNNGAKVFHHAAISGNNGHYAVAAPYDLVIGNGTVDAREFLGATNLAPAGIPLNSTGSNP